MSVTNCEPKLHNNQREKASTTLSETSQGHYKITVERKGLKIFGDLTRTEGNMWPKRMHDRIYSQNGIDAHGNSRNKFYNNKQQRFFIRHHSKLE